MKRLTVEMIALAAVAVVAFAIGLDVGHRMGYDTAWSECKFDAKEQLFSAGNEAFWHWHDSDKTIINKHRSFFHWDD